MKRKRFESTRYRFSESRQAGALAESNFTVSLAAILRLGITNCRLAIPTRRRKLSTDNF